MTPFARFTLSLWLALSSLFVSSAILQAATYTVTTADDGPGSFDEALALANANSDHDEIVFDLPPGETALHAGTIGYLVQNPITIQGPLDPNVSVRIIAGKQECMNVQLPPGSTGDVIFRRLTFSHASLAPGVSVNSGGSGEVRFEKCVIEDCSSRGMTVVDVGASGLTLSECIFRRNAMNAQGGALWLSVPSGDGTGPVQVVDCTFENNTSTEGGGAILSNSGRGTFIHRSTFVNNSARASGGAMRVDTLGDSLFKVTQSTFTQNVSQEGAGGAVAFHQGEMELINCTIVGNQSKGLGGGVAGISFVIFDFVIEPGDLYLQNCIVAMNLSEEGKPDVDGDTLSRGNNLIGSDGDASINFTDGVNGDLVGTNNAPIDPLLGTLDFHGGLTQSFIPAAGSPAINAGSNAALTVPPFDQVDTDQNGVTRILDGTIDIGSSEAQQEFWVAATTDSGVESLREAVTLANTAGGGTIRFRESAFGSSRRKIDLTSGPLVTTSNITIVGPEPGVIITGDDNSVVMEITAGTVDLSNLRLAQGKNTSSGGALRIVNADTVVTMEQCEITTSETDSHGGGVYVNASTLTLTDCTVSECNSDKNGGGLYATNGATVSLLNSTISGNDSVWRGGGVFVTNSDVTLLHCTVTGNTCDTGNTNSYNGGGLRRATGSATVRVGNCLVAENADGSLTGESHPDVSGSFVNLGHNLIGKGDGSASFVDGVNGDQVGTSGAPIVPGLASLAEVSPGLSRVHLLDSTSPARNAASAALFEHPKWRAFPSRDQRKQFRNLEGAPDCGSVEFPSGMHVRVATLDGVMNDGTGDTGLVRLIRSDADGALSVSLTIAASSDATAPDLASGASTLNVTLADGDLATAFALTPAQDDLVEGVETLILELLASASFTIDTDLGSQAELTIYDGDLAVTSESDSGAGSLREAIADANAIPGGGGQIDIDASVDTIVLESPLVIEAAMTINGQGVTVDGDRNTNAFEVLGSGNRDCVSLRNLIITRAVTSEAGAALALTGGLTCVEIEHCQFLNNNATENGGAVLIDEGAQLTSRASVFANNSATSTSADGGAIAVLGNGSATFINSTIARNACPNNGGGIAVKAASAKLINCTVSENLCDNNADESGEGGGLFADGDASVDLVNSILAGNQDTPENAGPGLIHPDISGQIASSTSNLIGVRAGSGVTFPPGSPNANGDYVGTLNSPLDAQLFFMQSPQIHYALRPSSPARDTGSNAAITPPDFDTPPVDQLGHHRQFLAVDMGAAEGRYFTVTNTNDSGNGSLRQRLDALNSAGHGWIDFNYTEAETITLSTGQLLVNAAYAIIHPNEDAPVTIDADESSRVLDYLPPLDTPSGYALKHLTITGGQTSGDGGGIRMDRGAAIAIRCTDLVDNEADGRGGAIAVMDGKLLLERCKVRENRAFSGGGIRVFAGNIKIDRCAIYSNAASTGGGGVTLDGQGLFSNSTFNGNTADNRGGGVYVLGDTELSLRHCTLTYNISDNDNAGSATGGGGIHVQQGTVNVQNTVVALNSDKSGSPPDVQGVVESSGGNFIGDATGATGLVSATGDLFGTNATPLDPILSAFFIDASDPLQIPYRLPLAGSPLVDAGKVGELDQDQRGNARLIGSQVDIGSTEMIPQEVTVSYPDNTANEMVPTLVAQSGQITFARSGSGGDLTFPVSLGGSADAEDFDLSPLGAATWDGSHITLPHGTASADFLVQIVDDEEFEGTEDLSFTPEETTWSTVGTASGNVTIGDNDILVTTTADAGEGSLRGAIETLNSLGGGLIEFDIIGVFASLQSIVLSSGELLIDGDITVRGPITSGQGVNVSGASSSRVFRVGGNAIAVLRNLQIANGRATLGGGLLVEDDAVVEVMRCTFKGNHSLGSGGAINFDTTGDCFLRICTVSGNTADGSGGGVFHRGDGNVVIRHSTLTLNTGDADADGIGTGGGSVRAGSGDLTLKNSIVANNATGIPGLREDLSGTHQTLGGNVIGMTGTSGFASGFPNVRLDRVGTETDPIDPNLHSLALNDGTTQSHHPKPHSPAISAALAIDFPSLDQRTYPRIVGYAMDSGSVEVSFTSYPSWVESQFPSGTPEAESAVSADFDGDGISNGEEFYLGLNPLSHDEDPYTSLVEDDALQLQFSSGDMIDPTFMVVEWSDNMTSWNDSGLDWERLPDGGAFGTSWRVSLPIAEDAVRLFLRLRQR